MNSELQPRSILVNGTSLAYVERGEGEPVIFVHGGLGDYRDWYAHLTPIAECYRVINYSRRRHYPNPWPASGSECLATEHAADLAAVIETLETGPAHLVGHSYGGLVSLLLATQRPELVRTLVLAEPPLLLWLRATAEGRALLDHFLTTCWEPTRRAFLAGDLTHGVRQFIDGVVGQGAFELFPPDARALLMDNAPEFRLEVTTPLERMFSTLAPDDVARLELPVLLLLGEWSPRFFGWIIDELHRHLRTSERVVIPGISHDLEAPELISATILAFLAEHGHTYAPSADRLSAIA